MASIGEAVVTIRAETGSFEGDINKSISNIGRAIAGLAIAKGAFDFVKDGTTRLGEMEVAAARTSAVIKSTGGVANVTASDIGKFGKSIQDTIGVQSTLVESGQNVLLKYTSIRNEIGKGNDVFDQARQAMVDLSIATGRDMPAAAAILGRALEDPEKATGALRRAGVFLSDTQQQLIKDFEASGNTIGAQKVILEAVNKTVGGSAELYGETLPAKLAVAEQKFLDMKASIASAFLPAIEAGASAVGFLADRVQSLPAPLAATVTGVVGLGAAFGLAAGPLNEMLQLGGSVAPAFKSVDGALRTAGLGGVAATAGFIGLTVAASGLVLGGLKLAGAFDEQFISSDKLATNSIPKLVTQFRDLDATGTKVGSGMQTQASQMGIVSNEVDILGKKIESGAVFYDRFDAVARKNVGTAAELRDALIAEGLAGEGTGISVGRLNTILEDAAVKHGATKGAVDTSTESLTAFSLANASAAERVTASKSAVDQFKITIESTIGPMLGALGANISYQEQVDKLTESLVTNGATFDLNEQAGRNNAAMLGQLTIDATSSTEQQIRMTGAVQGSSEAMDIATFKATQLANDILGSGAAAGISAEQMVRYAGDIGLIPPEAVTQILNNADVQAGLVQYFSGVLAGVNGQSSSTSINHYIRTFYETYGSPFSPRPSWADKPWGTASGGVFPAKPGGWLLNVSEAGSAEAVVPLGSSGGDARNRDRVMKRAGLFQVQPMASGGIVGRVNIGGRSLAISDVVKWVAAGGAWQNAAESRQAMAVYRRATSSMDRARQSPTAQKLRADTNKWLAAGGEWRLPGGGRRPASGGGWEDEVLRNGRWVPLDDVLKELGLVRRELEGIRKNQEGANVRRPPSKRIVGQRR